ncbi:MAG: hypothetical protein ACTSWQ_00790 [Candidatus Thorarchaeota archaeon]
MKKWIMILVLALVGLVAFTGCDLISTNPFVGTWLNDDWFEEVYWVFEEDMTYSAYDIIDGVVENETTELLSYSYTDYILTFYDEEGSESFAYEFINEDTFVLVNFIVLEFHRQ